MVNCISLCNNLIQLNAPLIMFKTRCNNLCKAGVPLFTSSALKTNSDPMANHVLIIKLISPAVNDDDVGKRLYLQFSIPLTFMHRHMHRYSVFLFSFVFTWPEMQFQCIC